MNELKNLALHNSFDELLEKLCDWLQLEGDDREEVVRTHALMIREAPMLLELEEATAHVKVFVDVGLPDEADAARVHRYLLVQNLQQPAPFFLTAGVHPATEHVIVYGYSPMPENDDERKDFFAFLETCALIHGALRSGSPAEFLSAAAAEA